jgi:hypothetical protein
VNITEEAVSIDNTKEEAEVYEGGIPSWAWGSGMLDQWATEGNWSEKYLTINQWFFTLTGTGSWENEANWTSQRYNVVEAVKISDNEYDIIFTYPQYKPTCTQVEAAARDFFTKNRISPVMLWEPQFYDPWDESASEYWDDPGFWDNTFFRIKQDLSGACYLEFVNGWENAARVAIYQKWWNEDYLNTYLARIGKLASVTATWYSKMKFIRGSGGVVTVKNYKGAAITNGQFNPEDMGLPRANSTNLAKVRALTNSDLYTEAEGWAYEFNTITNPAISVKPLMIYSNRYGSPRWSGSLGSVFCELDDGLYYEPAKGNNNIYTTQTVDYSKYNRLVIQFRSQSVGTPVYFPDEGVTMILRSGTGIGTNDNGGLISEHGSPQYIADRNPPMTVTPNPTISYDWDTYMLTWDYKQAFNKNDWIQGGVWNEGNKRFNLKQIYGISINFNIYDWHGYHLDIVGDIGENNSKILKIWLE